LLRTQSADARITGHVASREVGQGIELDAWEEACRAKSCAEDEDASFMLEQMAKPRPPASLCPAGDTSKVRYAM
jgi:hypothetical protein